MTSQDSNALHLSATTPLNSSLSSCSYGLNMVNVFLADAKKAINKIIYCSFSLVMLVNINVLQKVKSKAQQSIPLMLNLTFSYSK